MKFIVYFQSNIQYQHYPNRVTNPLAHISLESTSDEVPLRRHKSTRELKPSEEHTKHPTPSLPRSESTRRIDENKKPLGRSGTTRGLQRHPTTTTALTPNTTLITIDNPPTDTTIAPVENSDGPTFSKGSLLAKEEQIEQILYRQQQYEESQQNTLIQIDDRIKFAKGSLLDKSVNNNPALVNNPTNKMTRSKSVREVSNRENNEEPSPSSRRHVSLRRRPTGGKKQQHHDVPLPNTTSITAPINNNVQPPPPPPYSQVPPLPTSSNNNTLLQLDDTPERFHSRELHGRHVKPLLNFDSNERPTASRK